MADRITIAIAQVSPIVGDIDGNLALMRSARQEARQAGADVVVFSELFICGYPPEDLVQKPSFQRACHDAAMSVVADTADGGPAVITGAPWRDGSHLFNAAIIGEDGDLVAVRYKTHLPNYGVFDEPRRFSPGPVMPEPVRLRGVDLGVMVCEDMWLPGPAEHLREKGAEIFIVPHGSPFRETALNERVGAARDRLRACQRPLIFVNQLAGQDEIIFDGASFVMSATGEVEYRCPQFTEGVFLTQWNRDETGLSCATGGGSDWVGGEEMVYRAVRLAVRDYVRRNHFDRVVIGLSGGVDSALTAAIAVDALGPEAVRCVMMPSRYTARESLEDAAACAAALGVSYSTIPIEPGVGAFDEMLSETFQGRDSDITEENIQSRVRGVLLMAISNKFGDMVLTTGNKSEMSVGYATLYGDMNGGYNPLKDLYKTDVFALCDWRNQHFSQDLLGPQGMVIPDRILTKPPSAELRADQKDADSLPPYETLDPILEALVEKEMSVSDIVAQGFEEKVVRRIEHMVYVAEYKRRQAPPGPKVTAVNFGRDRRYPITNGWRDL